MSERRILRVLRCPQRTEEGIAEGTLASMQRAGSKKHPYEIWVMYQMISQTSHSEGDPPLAENLKSQNEGRKSEKERGRKKEGKIDKKLFLSGDKPFKVKVISAWKYPGLSPKGKAIPIPEEILAELGL